MTHSYHGLLVVDKPNGLTSRAAVDRCQSWFPPGTRLGHTGTLDPLATGVLVLCVGVATRLGEYVQRMAKTYRAGFLLGARSDSDDADGVIAAVPVERPPEREEVERALQGFVGEIEQIPPVFSAAKVGGRRAYKLARQGREVSLQPHRVRVYAIEIMAYAYPRLDLVVRCGKGTYIRSLARDLGEKLGCGALVETLRRTRVGPFDAADALSLGADAEEARARLLPLSAAVAELPRLTLEADPILRLRQGQAVPLEGDTVMSEQTGEEMEIAVFDVSDGLVAITRLDHERQIVRPIKVLSLLPN